MARVTDMPTVRSAPRTSAGLSLRREAVIGLLTFAAYIAVDVTGGVERRQAAAAHGGTLFRLEQSLHIAIEPSLNAWLADRTLIRTLANYEYAWSYLIAAFGLLVWLYVRRPDAYRPARSSFVALNLTGIACFAIYPLMPPRLVSSQGFVDTVTQGHTWGSWGSRAVDQANQLAAMPSLHVAWAAWVSAVLGWLIAKRQVQLLSAAHVAVTTWVIMATGNHYLLDAVGGAVLAMAATAALPRGEGRAAGHRQASRRVPAADAFFLYVETPSAPQHVGGVVPLDIRSRPGGAPTLDDVTDMLRAALPELPRFRQRLLHASRWRRPRWVDHDDMDWSWHVVLRDVRRPDGTPGGDAALNDLVAELAATPLPRDRPLWRFVLVHGIAQDRAAIVLLVHHVVADGIGTVLQAMRFLQPRQPGLADTGTGEPGPLRRAAAVIAGLGQLATDGTAPPLPSGTLTADRGDTTGRAFGTMTIPLADVVEVAGRLHARVVDVLLCMVAGGLSRWWHEHEESPPPERMRVAVPLMVRVPNDAAEGNVTAAVMVDVPLHAGAEIERLAEIRRRTARLRSGTRALASRFVMSTAGQLMPPPLHAWFSRSVYGGRYFTAIATNMPGPQVQLTLADAPILAAFPLLPLAPGTPLGVGALGWNGVFCLGISATPGLLTGPSVSPQEADVPRGLDVLMKEVFDELLAVARHTTGTRS